MADGFLRALLFTSPIRFPLQVHDCFGAVGDTCSISNFQCAAGTIKLEGSVSQDFSCNDQGELACAFAIHVLFLWVLPRCALPLPRTDDELIPFRCMGGRQTGMPQLQDC